MVAAPARPARAMFFVPAATAFLILLFTDNFLFIAHNKNSGCIPATPGNRLRS
jgi:hypothetical protein